MENTSYTVNKTIYEIRNEFITKNKLKDGDFFVLTSHDMVYQYSAEFQDFTPMADSMFDLSWNSIKDDEQLLLFKRVTGEKKVHYG